MIDLVITLFVLKYAPNTQYAMQLHMLIYTFCIRYTVRQYSTDPVKDRYDISYTIVPGILINSS